MERPRAPRAILFADDDPDDRMLVRDAFEESRLECDLRCVEDGEELIDYLHRRGKYASALDTPRPALILLDLNMPRKDGREAIREIKADSKLRQIPIIVLTTTQAEEDIWRSYDLGVNSFSIKPVVFEALVQVVSTLGKYWFETVELPRSRGR
jgi:CheY-like chemotaxis protein